MQVSWGLISASRAGSSPCGPRAPEAIQDSTIAISSAPGFGSSFGVFIWLLPRSVMRRMIRLPLASPGSKAGPCPVPRCIEA